MAGVIPGLGAQGIAQASVGGGVEGREAVIEQVKGWPFDKRASYGQSLPLAAGEVDTALVDAGIELAGPGGDEVAGLRDHECPPQLLIGRVGTPEPEVAATTLLLRTGTPNWARGRPRPAERRSP